MHILIFIDCFFQEKPPAVVQRPGRSKTEGRIGVDVGVIQRLGELSAEGVICDDERRVRAGLAAAVCDVARNVLCGLLCALGGVCGVFIVRVVG